MEKKLQDYAPYYIGCRCVNSWFTEDHDCYNAGWILRGIRSTHKRCYLIDTENDETWTDSIKLALRRLDDMTEEERIEVFGPDVIFFKPFDSTDACDIKQWHALLKKYFDLFGLIDAGIAIDASTLTK